MPHFGSQKSPDIKKMFVALHFAHHFLLLHFHQMHFDSINIVDKGHLKEKIDGYADEEVSLHSQKSFFPRIVALPHLYQQIYINILHYEPSNIHLRAPCKS